MIHFSLTLPDPEHSSLVDMDREELISAIDRAEAAGFTSTAKALMDLFDLLQTDQSKSKH